MSEPRLAMELKNITVRAGSQVLLDRVTLPLREGALVGLIGPNGAGKTTLVRVALGLRKPDEGEVRWFGMEPAKARAAGLRVGYVPQRGAWDVRFPMTVEETVLLGRLGLHGAAAGLKAEDRAAARRALEFMEISHLARHRLGSCSGGEQQRALVARALCAEPRVLILDEPTSAVDALAQDRFYHRLQELKKSGVTVLLVTHDVGMIASIADEVACLNQRLHFHGSPPEVMGQESLASAYGCEVELLAHGHVPHRVVRRPDEVGE